MPLLLRDLSCEITDPEVLVIFDFIERVVREDHTFYVKFIPIQLEVLVGVFSVIVSHVVCVEIDMGYITTRDVF